MNDVAGETPTLSKHRSPLRLVVDLFSSVWFGIILMVLLFFYMTVGSAGLIYPSALNIFSTSGWSYTIPRTWRWIDKTEMEFFAWWPFDLLMALFVINMVVVTVRRIRFTLLNAGVWMIHTGIVILTLASVYYFGTKLEGDTPVFRRHILIRAPGMDAPVRMLVRPDNSAAARSSSGTYRFRITQVNPSWPILTGQDKGKTTCSVSVRVQTPTESFVRQLLMNYPQYTEDILPGRGRAIKVVGTKLIDPDLSMSLELEAQTRFYLASTSALYVRRVGDTEWTERPIRGLTHYGNYIESATDIWQPDGDPVIQPDPLHLAIPSAGAGDPLGDMSVQVVGRLRYAPSEQTRAVPGGERLNPVIGVAIEGGGNRQEYDLAALHPEGQTAEGGLIAFRWARTPEQIDQLASQVGGSLSITVNDPGVSVTVPLSGETLAGNPELKFTPIQGTEWSYRIRGYEPSLKVGEGTELSVAIVEFKSPKRTITRWVADHPSATRDVDDDRGMVAPDPVITATHTPGPTILIVGGPGERDLTLVAGSPDHRHRFTVQDRVPLGSGDQKLDLTVTYFLPRARFETRPAVTPLRLRQRGAGEQFSRIKVLLEQAGWQREVWLPYHRYPLVSRQYAVPRRFRYSPTRITLPSGDRVELLFSRRSWPLPKAIALEDFQLKTHVGGFTGQTTSIRDFVSRLRYYDDGGWSKPFTASLNKPAAVDGIYFFQSEWDPANMAFTGLGVGNRNGVHMQLFGTCLAVAGMIFAFYIKPIIKRRRRTRVWSAVENERKTKPAGATAGATA